MKSNLVLSAWIRHMATGSIPRFWVQAAFLAAAATLGSPLWAAAQGETTPTQPVSASEIVPVLRAQVAGLAFAANTALAVDAIKQRIIMLEQERRRYTVLRRAERAGEAVMLLGGLSLIASFAMFIRYHSDECTPESCDGLAVGASLTLVAGLTLGLAGAATTVGARIRGRSQVRRIDREIRRLQEAHTLQVSAVFSPGGGSLFFTVRM